MAVELVFPPTLQTGHGGEFVPQSFMQTGTVAERAQLLEKLLSYDDQVGQLTIQHGQSAYSHLPIPPLNATAFGDPGLQSNALLHSAPLQPALSASSNIADLGGGLGLADMLASSLSTLALQRGTSNSLSLMPGQHLSREVPKLQDWLSYPAECVLVIHNVLQQLLRRVAPQPKNEQDRNTIIAAIQSVVKEVDKKLRIASYGSFLSGLYTRSSDLDLTIVPDTPAPSRCNSTEACNTLRRVERQLRESKFIAKGDSELRLHARIPLVCFTIQHTGIRCDLSYNNTDGIIKSIMLRDLGRIEPRFTQLFRLVKLWAQSQGINDPVNGTLNSWSLALMVIFHLQTVQPALLPPLKDLFSGVPGCSRGLLQDANGLARKHYDARVEAHLGFGANNQATIEELFSFFSLRYHRVFHALWSGESSATMRVCTWRGEWRAMKWHRQVLLPIEDPFDERDNCARTVDEDGFIKLHNAFENAWLQWQHVSSPQDVPELVRSLFGSSLLV